MSGNQTSSGNQPSKSKSKVTIDELGIEGDIKKFDATFSVEDDVATLHIDMIEGEITNQFEVFERLKLVAEAKGAKILRVTANIANERLYKVLTARYKLITEGGWDLIEIPLGGN